MTPALRLLPLRAVAARPLTSRSSARAFSTTLQRKQDDKGEAQSWNQAIHEINKSFNAGVKSAATAMENQLDDISANAKPYAEDIARRLKAVFGDGAPSVTDVQNELESQARRARYAVEQAAREVQAEAAADMKAAERLGKEKFGGKDGKEKHGHSD